MFRRESLFAVLWTLTSVAYGQIPTHTINFDCDSLFYENASFEFTEVIDARYDTTKLGFLKEGLNASTFQTIQLPKAAPGYVKDVLDNFITVIENPSSVAIVMHEFSVTEEPLGAIEIVKARVRLSFYHVQRGQYKFIREVSAHSEFPDREVTPYLSRELERALRKCITDFLTQPSSEGENQQWISRSALLKRVMPEKPLNVTPVGELTYTQGKFWLNGNRITKTKSIEMLEATGDAEILLHLKKYKRHGTYSLITGVAGAGTIVYTIATYIGTGDEFAGFRIMYAMGGCIISLIAAKSRRYQMRQAVELFNERYNR